MTSLRPFSPSRRQRRPGARSPLALVPLALLAACSDDDGNGNRQTAFSAVLDTAQELPAPQSGARVRVTITNRAPAMGT